MTVKKPDDKVIIVGIVEAQMLFAPFLQKMFVDAGFVIGFSCEFVAREDVERVQPDVLLIDVDYLSVDAVSQLRILRDVAPDCTICAYTGTLDEQWVAACVRAGANCVLSKLATPQEIVHGILRALRLGSFVDDHFDASKT
jgi:DNA-binding NarL/FixJ family response regulator